MNNIYIYNDTFNSLLSLIYELSINKIKPYNIKNTSYNKSLFDNLIYLNIDYDDIYIKFINKSNILFNYLYILYLSNDINKEIIMYYFYINYLKYGDKVFYLRNLKCVNETLRINKYVRGECHKFKGFTRFKELHNGVLYATINPTNNILDLLSNHFKTRLKNEYWIIKDVSRHILSIYNKKDYIIIDESNLKVDLRVSSNEEMYQDLWKNFYNTIGIKSRRNDRCRVNFMPKKYWKYILEVSDEN
mgnify:FL=1